MKILVACEESQAVTNKLRARGHGGDICENCLDDMSDQDHKKIDPEFMHDIMVRG